jgi:hypothetical protein
VVHFAVDWRVTNRPESPILSGGCGGGLGSWAWREVVVHVRVDCDPPVLWSGSGSIRQVCLAAIKPAANRVAVFGRVLVDCLGRMTSAVVSRY